MRVYSCFTGLVCLLLLSGCTQELSGHALPADSTTTDSNSDNTGDNTTPDSDGATLPDSDLRISEPTAADICSLTDKDALHELGQVETSPGVGFNACDIAVSECVSGKDPEEMSDKDKKRLPEDKQKCLDDVTDSVTGYVDIHLILQDTSALEEDAQLSASPGNDPVPLDELNELDVAGHTALEFPEEEHSCSYAVPLDQDAMLTINSERRNDSADDNDFCDIGTEALETAVDTLDADDVDELGGPDDSFVFMKLCGRIESDDVAIDGVDWSNEFTTDFGRSCQFVDGEHVEASARLAPGTIPSPDYEKSKGPDKLAGRPTWVTDYTDADSDESSFCLVQTPRKDDPPDPMEYAELATVSVIHDNSDEVSDLKPCDEAKSIAKNIWPKLDD